MVMSVRQTRGSQCGLGWSTHTLNEGVNLSGMLLCQPYRQDKPVPVITNVRYLNYHVLERMVEEMQSIFTLYIESNSISMFILFFISPCPFQYQNSQHS